MKKVTLVPGVSPSEVFFVGQQLSLRLVTAQDRVPSDWSQSDVCDGKSGTVGQIFCRIFRSFPLSTSPIRITPSP